MPICQKFLTAIFIFLLVSIFSPPKIFAQVVINEFVVDGSPEWVEFYNASDSAEYLKQYFIDDDEDFNNDSGNSGKKALLNIDISNINYPYYDLSSAIFNNSTPDYVVLFDQLGNVIDSYSYEESPGKDISIGRSPDGSGDFLVLQSLTKGSGNALPVPSPTSTPAPEPAATSTPEPTNTPAPTSTPRPPTNTPTLKPPTVTPTLKLSPAATGSGEILGQESSPAAFYPWEATEGAEPVLGEKSSSPSRFIPAVLLGTGFILLFSAAFWLWYTQLRK